MTATVIVLTTGGTIGHQSAAGVAVMDFDPHRLIGAIGIPGVDVEFRSVFRKGSMDVIPSDWHAIAAAILVAAADDPRGIVVLHGTDTMHYSAAALSFMLQGLGFPVVLSGSMIPGGDAGSDAISNLRDSILVAIQSDLAEVCIVFSADAARSKGVIIRGCRARKVHSHAVAAFASIGSPPIGFISGDTTERSELVVRHRNSDTLRLATALNENVVLIKMTPNLSPEALTRFLKDASGAVLEGYGTGHMRTDLHRTIAGFSGPVVLSTQTFEGGERLGAYDVDRDILNIPNIIPAGDICSDTALVKLMWALAQGGDVRAIMATSIAGEITEHT